MKSPRLYPSLLVAATCALTLLTPAHARDETTSSIKFSDPSKPGTVKILVAHGDLRIQGTDAPEVTVQSEARPVTKAPRKDGLRVLTASTSFALQEKDNVVTLDATDGWMGGGSDFRLTVPRNTSVVIQNSFGGDIGCAGVSGDIEIHSMNGQIRLDDVSGGTVVDTMNGEIRANIRELRENKPLSFTSMNGEVVLRVPSNAKANVRLRTQNGAVLTDFDEGVLVTKTESAPRMNNHRARGRGALPDEARDAIRESVRIATQAGREAIDAAREGIDAARRDTDHAKADVARAKAEADRARADRDDTPAPAQPVPPTAPIATATIPTPPVPPMPAIPTPTGGKLVTGTLNGGGPEITVATMNGDVVLRQLEKK